MVGVMTTPKCFLTRSRSYSSGTLPSISSATLSMNLSLLIPVLSTSSIPVAFREISCRILASFNLAHYQGNISNFRGFFHPFDMDDS